MIRCSRPPESWCGYCRKPAASVRDADLGEQVDGPLAGSRRLDALSEHRLEQEVAVAADRIDVGARVLVDHADLVCAQVPQRAPAHVQHGLPPEAHRA